VSRRCGYKWTATLGHQNWSIQAPGDRVHAIPGSPIYPDHWTIAWWYPGTAERITLAHSEAAALEIVREIR